MDQYSQLAFGEWYGRTLALTGLVSLGLLRWGADFELQQSETVAIIEPILFILAFFQIALLLLGWFAMPLRRWTRILFSLPSAIFAVLLMPVLAVWWLTPVIITWFAPTRQIVGWSNE